MPNGFCRSEEGLKAYSDIGYPYDSTVMDDVYTEFKKQTASSQHSSKSREEITKIRRVLADDGKEYLVYDSLETGYDNLGNERQRFRPNLGRYPIPVPRKELRMGPDMTQHEAIVEIIRVDTGYSIPFTKANFEKLHKSANDQKQRGATQYIVQRINQPGTTVSNAEAMSDGEFVQLEKWGMTLQQWTDQQKALQDLHKVAAEAKAPEEKEKAAQALAEVGERVSGPTETEVERAQRKEKDGISKEPEEEKSQRGSSSSRPTSKRY
jgi:hypothetical protein